MSTVAIDHKKKRNFKEDYADVDCPPHKRQKQGWNNKCNHGAMNARSTNKTKDSNSNSSLNANKSLDKSNESKELESESQMSSTLATFLEDVNQMSESCAKQLIVQTVTETNFRFHDQLLHYWSKSVNQIKNSNKQHCLLCHKNVNLRFDDDNRCTMHHEENEFLDDLGKCPCGKNVCCGTAVCRNCGTYGCQDFYIADTKACYIGEHVTSINKLPKLDIECFENLQEYFNDRIIMEGECDECAKIFAKHGFVKDENSS